MTDTKRIKDLTDATAPTAADRLPLDGATTRSITVENFAAYAAASPLPTRTLKDAATFALTSADLNKTILFDTVGSITQGSITATLPAITSAINGGRIVCKKVMNGTPHAGKMVISPPVIASTTGTAASSSTTLTVASATGIAVGQLVVQPDPNSSYRAYPGIVPGTKVTAVVGTTITLSLATVVAVATTVSGTSAPIKFYTDTIDGGGPRAYEIPGQAVTLVPDGVSNWAVANVTMASLGSTINGHHTVGSPFTVASPWPADPSTANGQLWEFIPENAASNIRANMPHPSLLEHGYCPAEFWLRRSDTRVSYLPFFYSTNATWDQRDTHTYPLCLDGYADSHHVMASSSELQTLNIYSAHQSEINCITISSTTSERPSNTIATPTNTIYAVPVRGFRVALPCSTNTTNYVWQWRYVFSAISHLLSSSTYGYAATNSTDHNAYLWVAPDGSLQLFLGASGAGSGEYTTLDGVRVNASALAGGVNAKSARWMATVTINGSGNVSRIVDDRIAPSEITARVGINAPSPTAGNATLLINRFGSDTYASMELTDSSTYTFGINASAAITTIKNNQNFPMEFGTNNTIRWTIPAAGGLFSTNATSGAMGIDTINCKGYYVDGAGIPNSNLATMAANTFKANNTGSTAAPANITVAQANALLGAGILGAFLVGANFNSTADQAITIPLPTGFTRISIQNLAISNPSISMTTAAGGFYTAASKGGFAFVAASQVYSTLTTNAANTAGNVMFVTIVNPGSASITVVANTVYLSLTTAQGSAATADIAIFYRVLP